MDNTYTAYFDDDYQVPTMESIAALNTIGTTNIVSLEQAAIIGIMNNYGSDSVIRIKDISIWENVGAATQETPIKIALNRITSFSGGSDVSITPLDSSTSLPAQVMAVINPYSTSVFNIIREIAMLPGLSPTTTLRQFGSFKGAGGITGNGGGMNCNHIFQSYDETATPIVIREGQGIALIKTVADSPLPYPIEVTIHLSDGTNSFIINTITHVQPGYSIFGLVNGSGSGVVLNISRVELREIRTVDPMKVFTISSCSHLYGGIDLPLIPMDSANTALSNKLFFKTNCSVVREGSDSSRSRSPKMSGDRIPFRKISSPMLGDGIATTKLIRNRENRMLTTSCMDNDGSIALREGEGLAVMQRESFSCWGKYSFAVTFTVTYTAPPSGGGEMSYVF